jgi:hypothetical protein
MSISHIIEIEAYIVVYGLALIVALKLLNSSINMHGLLIDKSQPSRVSPERIQLLIATISLSTQYLHAALVSQGDSLPTVGSGWLYLFGGSSAIYAVRKAVEGYAIKKRSKRNI